jgi:hypothetical protein
MQNQAPAPFPDHRDEFSSEITSDSTINLHSGLMPETTNSTLALEKRGNVDPTTQEYQQWQKEQ